MGFWINFIADCVAYAVTGSACNTVKKKKRKGKRKEK